MADTTPRKLTGVQLEMYMLDLEQALARRDALLWEALEAIQRWNDPARGIVNQRDLQKRIEAELGDSHD